MAASMKGGNHAPTGAMLYAVPISVIEWPTVKAVITGTRPQIRRKGMIRQSRNRRWSMPLKICSIPSLTNPTDAWYHAGSSATRPEAPVIIIALLGSPSGIKRIVSLT
jgi:hypothetical protein